MKTSLATFLEPSIPAFHGAFVWLLSRFVSWVKRGMSVEWSGGMHSSEKCTSTHFLSRQPKLHCTSTLLHTHTHTHTHLHSHTHTHLLHLLPSNDPHAFNAGYLENYARMRWEGVRVEMEMKQKLILAVWSVSFDFSLCGFLWMKNVSISVLPKRWGSCYLIICTLS